MRRLIFLVLAFAGATVHSQDTPVGAQPIDPLGTPPPQRATRKQQVDALGSLQASQSSEPESSEPSEALALLDASDPLEPNAQDSDETWVMDDQIADEEVAAYDDVRIVLDPGSVEEAQELVKFAALQLETSEYRDAARTINTSVARLE